MAARMRYPEVAPEGYAALQAFGHYCNTGTALEPVLLGMVYLRASVLNGCGFCIKAHTAELRKHNEPPSRIEAVSEGASSEAFTPREQAALAWTDVLTKLKGGPVSEEDYAAVSAFFEGKDLVDLCFAIANINAWNRMGVAFQPEWRSGPAKGDEPRGEALAAPAGNAKRAEEQSAVSVGVASAEAGSRSAEAGGRSAEADDDDGGKVAED